MKYTNLDLKKMEELEKLTGEKVLGYDSVTDSVSLSDGTEWKVLTGAEADRAACVAIRNSLWAFDANFILAHCENITDYNDRKKAIETIETMQLNLCESCNDADYIDPKKVIETIETMQSNLCESCNDIVFLLIGGGAGFEDFATDAIDVDGRGHFIAWYDGIEHEAGDFYAYRID